MKLNSARSIYLLALSFLIAFGSIGQTKNGSDSAEKVFYAQYNKMKVSVKEKRDLTLETKSKKEAESALKKDKDWLVQEAYRVLNEKLKESERINKDLESRYPQQRGEMNLIPLFEESTDPITDLPKAGRTDIDAYFKPYIDKVEGQAKQMQEIALKHNKYNDVYQKEGQAGLEKRAIDQANTSPLVQYMGGVENVKNMSEAERMAMGEKMKKDIQNNPGILTGNSNPGVNALTQKMMNDKEYAKRFNAMSAAEKQAEMKKYMVTSTPDPNFDLEKRNQEFEKNQREINKVKRAQDFQMLGGRTMDRLKDASDRYIVTGNRITSTINEMKKRVGEWASNIMAGIPIVELGEYGRDKDPAMVQALHYTERIAYYNIAKQEALLRAQAWKQFKNDCKYAILELNNYFGSYKWGQGSTDDLFNGKYFEPQVAQSVLGIYDLMLQIVNDAKGQSNQARGQQLGYEEALR